MKNSKQLLFILLVLTLGACQKEATFGGKTITIERNIDSDYIGLTSEGSFDIHIVNDQDYDLKITCPENKLPYIKTHVSDGELFITEKSNHIMSSKQIVVYVNKSTLNRLRNDGSGNIDGILSKTNYLDIENSGSGNIDLSCETEDHISTSINGSGNIVLSGSTNHFFANIDGSGNIDALAVPSLNADATIEGSGNILVNVSESLTVDIFGSGDVIYLGSPSLNVSITGSGEVKQY